MRPLFKQWWGLGGGYRFKVKLSNWNQCTKEKCVVGGTVPIKSRAPVLHVFAGPIQ